jgi:nicotinamide-nucleotide amidase
MSNNEPLAYAPILGQLLLDHGLMFACAESCTGGLLAAAMTDTPGSSQWFDRGYVTYSNATKAEELQVSIDTLERFGAVSEETAMEMASGVLTVAADAHLAVSTTGIAGPDGGTQGKPVGMVCFGFARRTSEGIVTRAMTKVFEGDRRQIRNASVAFALETTISFIELR